MSGEPPVLGAYGALRPNRSFVALVDLWCRLAVAGRPGLLRLLMRSISPADVGRYPTTVTEIASPLRTGVSVDVRLMSDAATDSEIVDFCQRSSALVLPCRWGTHSGQLELAYDLGTPVVLPRLDGFVAQSRPHQGDGPSVLWVEPTWLSDVDGGPLLASEVAGFLGTATAGQARATDTSWRLDEHQSILSRYTDVYKMNRR